MGTRLRASRCGSRDKCEDFLALDVRQLNAFDRLRCRSFLWQWLIDGEPVGAVRIVGDSRGLTLGYRAQDREVHQRVEFTCTPCHLGGQRTWFSCPDCRRRCAVLYGVTDFGRFSCRHCMNLAHESEAQDAVGRSWLKQRKLEAQLGPDGQKPKWMRWPTFARICAAIETVEDERLGAFLGATDATV